MSKTNARRTGRFALLGLALVLVPTAAMATETGPDIAPPRAALSPTVRDLQIVLRVRRALMTDADLGTQNVGVIVRDGVVTLWGPLTTGDEIRRAVKSVGEVRGVQSVRSELYVARDTRPAPPLWVLPETTTPDRLAPAFPERPTVLTHRNRAPASAPGDEVGPTFLPAPSTAMLLAPVPLQPGPAEPTTVTAARAEGVPAAIERLQNSDARFAPIGVDWHDGTLVLRSGRNDASAVMAFARLLADVPGVERVVLQSARKPLP